MRPPRGVTVEDAIGVLFLIVLFGDAVLVLMY
jgi:hypothetical protein